MQFRPRPLSVGQVRVGVLYSLAGAYRDALRPDTVGKRSVRYVRIRLGNALSDTEVASQSELFRHRRLVLEKEKAAAWSPVPDK